MEKIVSTKAYITYQDYGKETSTVSWHVQEITALNFSAITQNIDELRVSFNNPTLGTIRSLGFTRTFDDLGVTPVPPTNAFAQRETKWLVTMRDTKRFLDLLNTISNPGFGSLFSIEIPTANLVLLPPGVEVMDLQSEAALVASIETNVKSKDNANAPAGVNDTAYVKVLSIRHVGRNT